MKSPTSPMPRCFSESDLSLPPAKPPRSYNRRSQIENSNNQTYPRPLKLRLLELLQRNFNMFVTFSHEFRIYESTNWEKNYGFVDSEFVKICHEHVVYQQTGGK